MQTKLATLKQHAARQDWQGALRIAAKFQDLGNHGVAIMRGHEAHANARWAAQLGRCPAADIEAGIAALCERYGLNRDDSPKAASAVYGTKNNCVRAARKALGAQAMPGVDFDVLPADGGWAWAPVAQESPSAAAEAAPAPEPAPAPAAVLGVPAQDAASSEPAAVNRAGFPGGHLV